MLTGGKILTVLRKQDFKASYKAYGRDLSAWPDCERQIALRFFLHLADIANPCKPKELSQEWSRRITEEFFLQVRPCCILRLAEGVPKAALVACGPGGTPWAVFPSQIKHMSSLAMVAVQLTAGLCITSLAVVQGDEERRRGLPVSPLGNREEVDMPKSQLVFLDLVVRLSLACLALAERCSCTAEG